MPVFTLKLLYKVKILNFSNHDAQINNVDPGWVQRYRNIYEIHLQNFFFKRTTMLQIMILLCKYPQGEYIIIV